MNTSVDDPAWIPAPPLEPLLEEDKPPTSLELFNEQIAIVEARLAENLNLWDKSALESLKKERDKWYTPDGDALPVETPNDDLNLQFSPPEAQNLVGDFIVHPKGLGMRIPWQIRNSDVDPSSGLRVSKSRSNGCFLVMNKEETADRWINDTAKAAEEYNVSERILRVAGYGMKDFRYMLPTRTIPTAFGYAGYEIEAADVPFNEDETRVWAQMFRAHHFNGAALAGAAWVSFDVEYRPLEKQWQDRLPVDPNGRHKAILVANHPQWIIPHMMVYFNSAQFKSRAYAMALNTVHRIDAHKIGRVPGYTSKDDLSGGAVREEGTSQDEKPRFRPGSDLI